MIKRLYLLPAGLCLLLSAAAAMELKLDSLSIGSVVYTNVVITSVNPSDIYFQHRDGMANVKLRQLDPRIQRKFNYDPERATFIEQQQAIDNAQYSRDAAMEFANHVAQERAAARARETAAPEQFTLVDPATPNSPINKPAPRLELTKWFSAKPPGLAGKFSLLFFWSSDSQPCRSAVATFNDFSKNHPDNVVVIGVTSETEAKMRPLDVSLDFFSGSDPGGKYLTLFGINSLPAAALIDPKGVLRYAGHPAALTEENLNRLIAQHSAP